MIVSHYPAVGLGTAWDRYANDTKFANGVVVLADADLAVTANSNPACIHTTTSYATGKHYFEILYNTSHAVAVTPQVGINVAGFWGPTGTHYYHICPNATIVSPTQHCYQLESTGFNCGIVPGIMAGSVIMVAADFDGNKLWFGVDGVWDFGWDPATNSGGLTIRSGTYYAEYCDQAPNAGQVTGRFKAGALQFTPPTGFSAWDPGV